MTTTPPISAPALGGDLQGCPECGEPLRSDQRYCLNCGRRRTEMRLPFLELVGPHGPQRQDVSTAAVAPAPAAGAGERSPLVALGLLLALLLALGIGVLIGHGARGSQAVARAPVVNVTAAPATGATGAGAAVVGDWPAGRDGWTVSLRTLPATATPAEVDRAKRAATAAGATAVGALRSDEFASLSAGQIIIYAGMYTSEKAAKRALGALRKDLPGAKLVHVAAAAAAGTSAPKRGATTPPPPPARSSGLTPQEYQKRSKKLPDEVQSQGTAPPADDKAPGGGSGAATEIG